MAKANYEISMPAVTTTYELQIGTMHGWATMGASGEKGYVQPTTLDVAKRDLKYFQDNYPLCKFRLMETKITKITQELSND